MDTDNLSDVVGRATAEQTSDPEMYVLLKGIKTDLDQLVSEGIMPSQSAARAARSDRRYSTNRNDNSDDYESYSDRAERWKPNRRSASNFNFDRFRDDFFDSFSDSLIEGLTDSKFSDLVSDSLNQFADALGVELKDIPKTFGKALGNQVMNAFKNTRVGQDLTKKLNDAVNSVANLTNQVLNRGTANVLRSRGGYATSARSFTSSSAATAARSGGINAFGGLASGASRILASNAGRGAAAAGMSLSATSMGSAAAGGAAAGGAAASAGASSLGSAAAAAGSSLAALGPYALIAVAAIVAVTKALKTLKPAVEGVKDLFKKVKETTHRSMTSTSKNLELATQRIKSDIMSMIETPFKILEESANRVSEAWDSALNTVTSTQGYSKADLQDLMSTYAQRLRDEGLFSVVSSADITTNLQKVLQSGLSGAVAEEFAYLATKLNAAVPTEDFFNYASTYASMAANAIQRGMSQKDAIALANRELEQFASTVLYANRQIAGGFSTGLKNASELLTQSVKIVNSARMGNIANVSGVLTSISAIVGAVAPDLASSIVDKVVELATGGNNSATASLRSLAGVGASNTEFLRAIAKDPQTVFANLFNSLASLQKMSNNNFMEVAEGLSNIFGVSMDAFARVDFNYLADAISSMNVNNASLAENMSLLVEGQTISNAEQMRIERVNKYILEEGLAYILDNEVARAVQEHMWQEQLAREQMEATYGVELEGAALKALQGIFSTVQNILAFLNPFSFLNKIADLAMTTVESFALESDLGRVIAKGRVGKGNIESLRQLLTRNTDLHLTQSYLGLQGSMSAYRGAKYSRNLFNLMTGQSSSLVGTNGVAGLLLGNIISTLMPTPTGSQPQSSYQWNVVGKSVANYLKKVQPSGYEGEVLTPTSGIAKTSATKMQAFVNSIGKAVQNNMTYAEWKKTASNYGIADLDAALSDYDTNEVDLMSAFQQHQAQKASQYKHDREVIEDQFWDEGINFWTIKHPEYEDTMIDLTNTLIEKADIEIQQLMQANSQLLEFYKQWVEYYVNHTAYTKATLSAYNVAGIRNAERGETGDAVLALAEALTSNMVDLKDPQVQQNVLLAQILKVVEAIMQQNNNTSTVSLPTALASLGLGLTYT